MNKEELYELIYDIELNNNINGDLISFKQWLINNKYINSFYHKANNKTIKRLKHLYGEHICEYLVDLNKLKLIQRPCDFFQSVNWRMAEYYLNIEKNVGDNWVDDNEFEFIMIKWFEYVYANKNSNFTSGF
jgi:hypothetical protein